MVLGACKWLAVAAVWCALAASPTLAVDRSKFRTCEQTQFCNKHRFASPSPFTVVASSVSVATRGDAVEFELTDGASSSQLLQGRLQFVLDAAVSAQPAVRLHVEEKWTNPQDPKKRWENGDVLMKEALVPRALKQVTAAEAGLSGTVAGDALLFKQADVVVALRLAPFGVDVYLNKEKVISTNDDKQFHFEARADRASGETEAVEAKTEDAVDVHEGKTIVDYGEDGLAIYSDGSVQKKAEPAADTPVATTASADEGWEESFGGHTDKKKFGPSSVGLDISFHGKNRGLYGIPEHASDFLLKNTVETTETGERKATTDPYRLYNLDVFEHDLDVPMALYGSIPVLVAPDATSTVGVFWHNPSETFVDIETKADATKKSHWLSESGVVDLFFMVGPTSKDFFSQYTLLTGRAQMPPMFAVSYHQCRWNYKNEADVDRVDAGFDEHLIPYDVLWLDIEHTNGKRYFTWDEHAFPTPQEMQSRVARTGRKMVTIVDPHIKVDAGYAVHDEATAKGLYIKDEEGKDFNGWCWPGNSAYVDFTSLKARRWWSSMFRYENYEGSTKDLFTWNDMNEPSVFNGPEVSMRKTCTNLDGVEHREWHNMYGMYMQQATMEGQLVRQLPAAIDESQALTVPSSTQRPFVLSRAFFAGSQRFGAVWTGDNAAQWSHLKYATKMLLSMSVAGLTFVGADVGGFFGNPDTELLTRWYQAAAYQPFFRGHAHHDSARREPWLFGEPHTSRIRNAIRWRYALLPYVYTLFHSCASAGQPVMRPLWMHFPQNPESFTEEDEFLLGEDLLVKPITEAGVTQTDVFLPGSSADVWYNVFDNYAKLAGGQVHAGLAAPLEYSPVFQRGGSVVPRKNRVRRSSALMKNDPLTLVVALDTKGLASGELYVDDEQSFAFEKYQAFTAVAFSVDARTGIRASVGHRKFTSTAWVERIEVVGLNGKLPQRVTLTSTGTPLETQYDATRDALVIRKPAVLATDAWEISFTY